MTKRTPFPAKTVVTKGRTLSDFKAKYDKNTIVPDKIRKGLQQLGKSWEQEADFVKRCGLSQTDIARYRDQFSDNWIDIKTPRHRIWTGNKDFADELRATVQ